MSEEKPNFSSLTERQKFQWLMARCHKAWALTRHNGSCTVACDLTTPDGQYHQFETTMPNRQSAIVHACERVWSLRNGQIKTMSLDDMIETLAKNRKWFNPL